MGFLLMQYEFQRASHEVTVHEAAKVRYDNLQERYTKRVEKMESIFTKRKNQMETEWRNYSSQATATINGATGGSGDAFNAMLATMIVGGHCLGDYVSVQSNASIQDLTTAAQKVSALLQQLISAAKEADIERIEDQEESMLDPIREKDTEMQAKSNLESTLTTIWQQRKDNAEQRLGQDIKGAFSGYTLGG